MSGEIVRNVRSNQNGFSLLEILVAFSIMAMSLGLLYQMLGTSTRHVGEAIQNQRAVWLIESLLSSHTSLSAAGWNEDGERDGFMWQVRSVPFQSEVKAKQIVPLHKIELNVRWKTGVSPKELSVISLLPERMADSSMVNP